MRSDPFGDPVTRRRLLQRGGAAALGLSALSYWAACGTTGGPAALDAVQQVRKGPIADDMYMANWPLYIDVNEKTKERGTLVNFEKKFGVKTKYVEEINDNTQFFGKVRQQYAQGNSGGRDIHVVTDWMAAKMKRLGYVQKLDDAALPNVRANLIDRLTSPPFDPKRQFSVPWQTGQTGIIYRKDKVKRKPESVNDLFDPDYKGKVTMLTEMRDTVGLVMLGMGANPETDGVDAALKAIEKVGQASDSGQVRGFTGNEYTKDISRGDSWVIIGWSGDAVQLTADNPNIEFVVPDEGFMLWTDNMQIPVGAPHAYTAEVFMNYVYDPEVQAPITEYVNYVCPVKGVKEIIEKKDPELAASQLIFPDEETFEKAYIFRDTSSAEELVLDEAFQKVLGA